MKLKWFSRIMIGSLATLSQVALITSCKTNNSVIAENDNPTKTETPDKTNDNPIKEYKNELNNIILQNKENDLLNDLLQTKIRDIELIEENQNNNDIDLKVLENKDTFIQNVNLILNKTDNKLQKIQNEFSELNIDYSAINKMNNYLISKNQDLAENQFITFKNNVLSKALDELGNYLDITKNGNLSFISKQREIVTKWRNFIRDNLPQGYALVNRIADGDTIYGPFYNNPSNGVKFGSKLLISIVEDDSGETREKSTGVRFRGVDTPETLKNNPEKDRHLAKYEAEWGEKAKIYFTELIRKNAGLIYLYKSTEDHYGRWIALFFTNQDMNNETELSVQMVRDGYARVAYISNSGKFKAKGEIEKAFYKTILEAQTYARENHLGFWNIGLKEVFGKS
ncbi:thermonuclease family protein [Mycoplasma sp. Pen4]|uniref:thermonuclease family protein n=1 Tax=Mycoplasma sp. Pen4 TaxID=640330 RepID=UPI0016549EAF|nr:thermonuclease family protein [Mycoplasma sp. Pen4]QNM93362.1 thermonuclease family protein [Mycoplasma sp. Pen4]